LVEKDRVLRGYVSFTCGEEKGGRPFLPDVRSLGIWKSGIFGLEGMGRIIKPCQVGSTWHGPFKIGRLGLSFGSWDVPGSVCHGLLPPRDPLRIVGPFLPSESGAVVPGIGHPALVIWSRVSQMCPVCWAVIGGPRYLRFKNPTVAPEPLSSGWPEPIT
jgi:hypothetical protein